MPQNSPMSKYAFSLSTSRFLTSIQTDPSHTCTNVPSFFITTAKMYIKTCFCQKRSSSESQNNRRTIGFYDRLWIKARDILNSPYLSIRTCFTKSLQYRQRFGIVLAERDRPVSLLQFVSYCNFRPGGTLCIICRPYILHEIPTVRVYC